MYNSIASITETARFKEVMLIILVFFASRLLTWFLGYYSYRLFEPINPNREVWNYTPDKKLNVWAVWDSGYYLGIAKDGYSLKLGTEKATLNQANYAFFPLYPYLIHLTGNILNNYVLAGILISNACLFVACFTLYHLVKQEFNMEVAQYSVLYLLAFPTAFVLTSVYSESLFLALSLATFYFGKNNKFLLAGVCGLLAALTRSIGIFLVIPLLIYYIKSKSDSGHGVVTLLKILLVPLGTMVYAVYVKILTGSIFSFITIQSAWGRKFEFPLKYVIGGLHSNLYQHRFTSVFIILTMIMVLACFKYLKTTYSMYAVVVFLVPLLSGLTSMPRYTLVIFPIYIALGVIAKKYNYLGNLLLLTLALTQGMMMVFWTSGSNLLM